MRRISRVVVELHRLAKPTITSLNGVTAGFGANLALAANLVIAARGASLIQIFARRALSLDGGGSWLLPRLVGLRKAKELAFFADPIGAEEARPVRFVQQGRRRRCAGRGDGELGSPTRRGPPVALASTKEMLNASFEMSLDVALRAEFQAQLLNTRLMDFREALTAFKEKREAHYRGR